MTEHKPVLVIDGEDVATLDDLFYKYLFPFFGEQGLVPNDYDWAPLDLLWVIDTLLAGVYSSGKVGSEWDEPALGFVLRWRNSSLSRDRLGYSALADYYLKERGRFRAFFDEDIKRAKRQEGPTLFDLLVELLQEHGPGGADALDGVELILE